VNRWSWRSLWRPSAPTRQVELVVAVVAQEVEFAHVGAVGRRGSVLVTGRHCWS